ncbi:MAG: integrase [Acidobacteria bacterium]|nr:MAG: integrase [Acidobacteriota bacterium]
MIEQFLSDPVAVQRMRASPIGSQLDSFAARLTQLGYARASGRDRLWTLSALGRWLRRRHLGMGDLRADVAAAFLTRHSPARRVRRSDQATLRLFLDHLETTWIIPASPSPALSPILQLKARYEAYLQHDRGLSPVTGPRHWFILRRFVRGRFGEGPIDLRGLTADDVTRHVLAQIPSRSPASAQLHASTLRSFLRFLWQTGVTTTDLTAAIEVTRVLNACDQSSPVGRRDYAILLLLARLGLRGGEVVRLELDDIDWHTGALTVRGKGSIRSQLPLPSDVGEALATYLRRDRPRCATRRVFVRVRAPHRGLGHPSTVSTLVRMALTRAAVNAPMKGAHVLRHSLATDLLRRGASLADIGDVLRHQQPNTTEIYAKVDFTRLRLLAQPWPVGGAR